MQVYVTDLVASTVRPRIQLRAFDRVHVRKGETAAVELMLDRDAFSLCGTSMETVVEPGEFRISVGASSKDIRLSETIAL